jgi:hypothetical protein
MTLSIDCVLLYVLRGSGVLGRLTSGRIECHEGEGIRVYDRFDCLNDYVSGARLRSWSVFCSGCPIPEWSHVMPEDAATGKGTVAFEQPTRSGLASLIPLKSREHQSMKVGDADAVSL